MTEEQDENFDARYHPEDYYEQKAAELEVTVDYYMMEFVG